MNKLLIETGKILGTAGIVIAATFAVQGHADEEIVVHPNEGPETSYPIEFQKTTVQSQTFTIDQIKGYIHDLQIQLADWQDKLDKAQEAVDNI